MNFHSKFQNFMFNRKVLGGYSNNYVDFQLFMFFYLKYKSISGTKNLGELKKLALEEAKKISSILNNKKNKNARQQTGKDQNLTINKEFLLKILSSIYDIINPHLTKLNLTFKNERRKFYKIDEKYLEIVKSYEQQKINLLTFAIKSFCKMVNLEFSTFKKNILSFLEKNDIEIINKINSFRNLGKLSVFAPQYIDENEIEEIVKSYYENLKKLISQSKDNEMTKFSFILISDIIYENYGIEEEQIFACIEERKFTENKEIEFYFNSIKKMMQENFNFLFDI